MDYQIWMTEALAKMTKGTKAEYPENRAGRRAKAQASRKRGKHFTK